MISSGQEGHSEIESEDMNISESRSLIPDSVEDEKKGVEHFVDVFMRRYSEESEYFPFFYVNTLENAVKDATHSRYLKRRPLALYLHDDKSILANVFCTKILCSQPVTDYFQKNNFLIWPWDLTNPRNYSRFFSNLNRKVGTSSAAQIRVIPRDRFPTIILLHKYQGVLELITVIYGDLTLAEVMSQLVSAYETFSDQIEEEKKAENDRIQRRQIREEQDKAYEDSLRQDEEKARKRVEKEKQEEAQAKKIKLENEETEKLKNIEKAAAAKRLPSEPKHEDTNEIINIRLRLPVTSQSRRYLVRSRRFYLHNLCKHVFDYACSIGYPISQYKLITTYPRIDITTKEPKTTLKELGLSRQETLTAEER